jgi:PTH1 family peptidyl-tRNA hydrolase
MERLLVVGLGNPEPRYAANRHNIGFMVIEHLARRANIQLGRKKFNGLYGSGSLEGQSVVLMQPQTFMNLSGRSVAPACRFFGIKPEGIIVVHDELDLPFGRIRLKAGGGHAGHNGLRSIIAELGSREFGRLRVGIGRPEKGSVSSFVLSDFDRQTEEPWLDDLYDRTCHAIRTFVRDGMTPAMNEINAT